MLKRKICENFFSFQKYCDQYDQSFDEEYANLGLMSSTPISVESSDTLMKMRYFSIYLVMKENGCQTSRFRKDV